MSEKLTQGGITLEEFSNRAVRHGECLLYPVAESFVDEIGELKREYEGQRYIVAHSETGHHHVAVATGKSILEVFKGEEGRTFMKVSNGPADLVHQKEIEQHPTKTIEAGWYEVKYKNSYDYSKKALARVMD